MSYNRCKDTHKFGNKYLPSTYKTQIDFRSHFSGKKVRLMVREIWYVKMCFFLSVKIFNLQTELHPWQYWYEGRLGLPWEDRTVPSLRNDAGKT